jgi:hypothetical protein
MAEVIMTCYRFAMHTLKPAHYIGIFALSIVIVFLTLLIPASIADQAGLSDVSLGYPFPFVHQDYGSIDPPSFPRSIAIGSPWEYGVSITWPMFLLDIIIVFAILSIIFLLIPRKIPGDINSR